MLRASSCPSWLVTLFPIANSNKFAKKYKTFLYCFLTFVYLRVLRGPFPFFCVLHG